MIILYFDMILTKQLRRHLFLNCHGLKMAMQFEYNQSLDELLYYLINIQSINQCTGKTEVFVTSSKVFGKSSEVF